MSVIFHPLIRSPRPFEAHKDFRYLGHIKTLNYADYLHTVTENKISVSLQVSYQDCALYNNGHCGFHFRDKDDHQCPFIILLLADSRDRVSSRFSEITLRSALLLLPRISGHE